MMKYRNYSNYFDNVNLTSLRAELVLKKVKDLRSVAVSSTLREIASAVKLLVDDVVF